MNTLLIPRNRLPESMKMINQVLMSHDLGNASLSEDSILIFHGELEGMSIGYEVRDVLSRTLTGPASQQTATYILYGEVTEHNYPHEPDWVDVQELAVHYHSPLDAVRDAILRHFQAEVDRTIEHIVRATVQEELDVMAKQMHEAEERRHG